ncbi:MAG: hypothetical protein KDA57_07845 [Planctomycetales bacterium]|nr:hypothetical protein [Planctomycetales bacterium]
MALTPIDETCLTMSTASLPIPIPKPVTRKVSLLRWLIRLYVLVEGIASILLVLGCAFWIGLAVDWTFEPVPAIRVAIWTFVMALTLYVAVRFLVSRTFRRLPDSSLALLLERNCPELDESLITTLEAADRRRSSSLGNPQLLQRTGEVAALQVRQIKLRRIFRFHPLLWKTGLAATLLFSILAFAFLQKDAFGFWINRMALSEVPWPRRVQLAVLGLENPNQRIIKVARDDDFELQVNASILQGHVAPEQVEIRYRLADGRRGRDTMTKVGEGLVGRDDGQRFTYSFRNVAADLEFDLIGGDDRLRNLKLQVVERPQIVSMLFECEFPEYMQRSAQSIPVSGRIELPEGSTALCLARANKPLKEVSIYDPVSQQELPVTVSQAPPDQFTFELQSGLADQVLLITMRDSDAIQNREPYRVVVSAIVDQPPEVSVLPRGISTAVTPQATIPFGGEMLDEYGMEETWFEYQIDQAPPERRTFASQPAGRRRVTEIDRFDLAETDSVSNQRLLSLQPGQQLTLSVKARDAYNLQAEPHIGSSQRFSLDIVTTSELRALLEKRELGLRQRFEAIYEKMVGTAELLTRIETEPATPQADTSEEDEQERRRERDRLRLSGALQNVTQLSFETLGVADGFGDIVLELMNNRVDTEELRQRLEGGIADPLREIATQQMTKLESLLQQLESSFAEQGDTKLPLAPARAQAEAVSEAMKEVLDRMLELESYNELVELLRGILDEQQQLEDKTKELRREKLKGLLDDE